MNGFAATSLVLVFRVHVYLISCLSILSKFSANVGLRLRDGDPSITHIAPGHLYTPISTLSATCHPHLTCCVVLCFVLYMKIMIMITTM